MSSIEQAGEFNLIHHLASIGSSNVEPPIIAGIGDDAAVYRTDHDRVQLVTTDTLIEGYHFDFTFYNMEDAGYKAMAVNLRDVAAMIALSSAIAERINRRIQELETVGRGYIGFENFGVMILLFYGGLYLCTQHSW